MIKARLQTLTESNSASERILVLRKIRKYFGGVRALENVSFDLCAGEVHALLGENGAGKSTLIKIITGVHQADSGSLQIGGQNIATLTPSQAGKLGIACIYQQPMLFPDLTVSENIALRLGKSSPLSRVNWLQCHRFAKKLFHEIGANFSPEAHACDLSMPEQQLVEIACALGIGARILIMDEPTSSLTQSEQQLLFSIIRNLRANGAGIIYISHRLEEIFLLADRLTILRDGESIATHRMSHRPALTRDHLIKLMIGREISHIFPPPLSRPGEIAFSVKNLTCKKNGIHSVNLDICSGEILGLAGLVGAGRTELAHILFGITPADAGEIKLHGQRIIIKSPRKAIAHGIAYVPEDRLRHGVIMEMPIAANMTMAIHSKFFRYSLLRLKAENSFARQFIQRLEIKTHDPEVPASSLSGGNQQKVSIARWLATKPKLLILDEPTQGVDIGAKSEIHKIIRQLAAEGLAVLMISSDISEILGMSDRIAVMRNRTITTTLPGGCDAQKIMEAAMEKQLG